MEWGVCGILIMDSTPLMVVGLFILSISQWMSCGNLFFFFFLKTIYLFIWLHRILVPPCNLHCSAKALVMAHML